MSRAATAPDLCPAGPVRRRRSYPLIRRDPRRFARGLARVHALPAAAHAGSSDWRFFAQSFAAAFLFVSLLIA